MIAKVSEELPKIGAPALRALESIGITKMLQLTGIKENDLLKLHGFGPKTLKILRKKLCEVGLAFKT